MISDRGKENSERNYKMLEELANNRVYMCVLNTPIICVE